MCHKYERKQELKIIDFPLRSIKNNEQKKFTSLHVFADHFFWI